MKPVFLYRITNGVNGKVYIGSTVSPASRWAVYRSRCHNSHLKRAFEKYGLAAFTFDVVACVLNPADRDSAESLCITAYRACDPEYGYNQIAGGLSSQWSDARRAAAKGRVSPNRGNKCSADTRERMSAAQKGKTVSPETRQKLSASIKKARAEKFWRSHSGQALRTGPHKPETIEKLRAAALRRWAKRKEESAA